MCKVLPVKWLRQITVVGMGLLGSSITIAASRCLAGVRTVGYSHRQATRDKARAYGVADVICDDIADSVKEADIVIVASPVRTFEVIFRQIAVSAGKGCIITDVGSVKVLPHRWAEKSFGQDVHYVGSHPIAGSEKRGLEFGRDDLFANARCILTRTERTDSRSLGKLRRFWEKLGCCVAVMTPAEHDRILGRVSHVPHVTAAALVNASDAQQIKYAGKGFMDTSRVASGPANVWTDILLSNRSNICRGIEGVRKELGKLKDAIESGDEKKIEKLLTKAADKREQLIKYKMKNKELL